MMEAMMAILRNCVITVAALLIADQAIAQTTPDIVGDWHGNFAATTGDEMIALTVTRGVDGVLKGEFERHDVTPGRKASVTEIAVANGRLIFKIETLGLNL